MTAWATTARPGNTAAAAARRRTGAPLFRSAFGDCPPRWADPAARACSGTGAGPEGRSGCFALAGHAALVVDDEPMILEILAQHCLALGMSVREAAGGAAAFALLEAHLDIGVLVTDVRMPGLDGPSLAERALSLRPGLKVIFVTGYTTYRSLTWPVLRKPFDLDELEAALRRALG